MADLRTFDSFRPYAELDQGTQRVLEVSYRHLVEEQAPVTQAVLRYDTRASNELLTCLVRDLHLLQEVDGADSRGLVPTLWGCLYLPEAQADLATADAIIRYAHSTYRPHHTKSTKEELLRGLDVRTPPTEQDLRRISMLSRSIGLSTSDLSLSMGDGCLDVTSLAELLAHRWPYGHEANPGDLTVPVPFRLMPTEVRASRFRALRHVRLPLQPLTVLVGRNGAGKSTLLDVFGLLSLAAQEGLGAALVAEGGLPRLRTRGSTGPISLGFDATLDYGDARPVTVAWDATFDSIGEHVVVERETLVVNGASILDARRGRTRLTSGDGRETDLLLSPASLVLTSDLDVERYPLVAQLRAALTRMALVDRDPVVLEATGLEWFARGQNSSRRRLPTSSADLLAPIAADEALTQRLGEYLSQLVPAIAGATRQVRAGEPTTLRITERGGAGSYSIDELSAGTRQMLLLAALLLHETVPSVVLLEEPEAGIHPAAHAALSDLLRSLSERTTVLATTHAPGFVELLDPAREVVVLERDGGDVRLRSLAAALEGQRWLETYESRRDAFTHLEAVREP